MADAVRKLDARALGLVDVVRSLVGCGLLVRAAGAKSDVPLRGEGVRAHVFGRAVGLAVGVRLDPGDVEAAEGLLDALEEGQLTAASRDAFLCSGVDRRRAGPHAALHVQLNTGQILLHCVLQTASHERIRQTVSQPINATEFFDRGLLLGGLSLGHHELRASGAKNSNTYLLCAREPL